MIIVPHTQTAHPTARSRALAERLRETIADFQMREPKVTTEEIAMALREAQSVSGAPPRGRAIAIITALTASLLAFGLVFLRARSERTGQEPPMVSIVAIVIVLLAAVAVVVMRLRNNG